MIILDAKNPVKNTSDSIIIEVLFYELQNLGYIAFTATPTDTEAHGRELYERANAGEFGALK